MNPLDAKRRLPFLLTAIVAFSLSPAGAAGSRKDAARRVREGVRSFRSGDYEAAARAFAEADVALPQNAVIAFNQGCTHAARNEPEKAIDLLQAAALARDQNLAASAHYNLGCVAAAQARALFGEKPEEATPETRSKGLQLLLQAVGHYRDCLQTDSSHAAARRNLEVLRLWIKHMRDVWADRDRQKRREETNLLDFLEIIQSQQQLLRGTAKALDKQPDSPKRRQAVADAEDAQRTLADEIGPLKEKIAQSLQPPSVGGPQSAGAAGAGQPAPQTGGDPDTAKAVETLSRLADRSRASMLRAADDLASRPPGEAVVAQTEALDALNDIYVSIAPFAHMLAKATTVQQELVDQSSTLVEGDKDAEKVEPDKAPASEPEAADLPELARNQRRVECWSEVLPLKARQQQQQLAAGPPPPPPPGGAPPGSQNSTDPDAQQQREALSQSLDKAVQLSPQIQKLAGEAAERLEAEEVQNALPRQQEALRLLKEIAESVPKQQPQNQGQQNEQQKSEEHKQQQDSPQQQQQKREQQQRDISQRQAEAVLQRVRERERQHSEAMKQLRGYRGSVPVEKDW